MPHDLDADLDVLEAPYLIADLDADLDVLEERLRQEAARLSEDLDALDEQARQLVALDLTPAARDDLDAVLAELAALRETLR